MSLISSLDSIMDDLDSLKMKIEEHQEEYDQMESDLQDLENSPLRQGYKDQIQHLDRMLHRHEYCKEPLDLEALKEISESLNQLI